ncbi:MAG TPA: ABC transporter permease subunit [Pseudonocardiaceae bacterium]|jgi:hypothetical protein
MMIKSLTVPQRTRARVGARDLLWLAWRQHRWVILSGAVLVAVLCGYMLSNEAGIVPVTYQSCGPLCTELFGRFPEQSAAADVQLWLATGFGGLVGVFWAAPLVAREFEQGTQLLAWSQDVSARRWLVGKVVVLAVAAVGFAAVLGVVAGGLVGRLASGDPTFYSAFSGTRFEASASLQASFALFGFALGLAASVLLRRTIPAMGVTLVLFAGVRGAVSLLRLHYLPPIQLLVPVGGNTPVATAGRVILSWDMVNTAGQVVTAIPANCMLPGTYTEAVMNACLVRNGILHNLVVYQPADRLPTFRLIETGIFVVLAVALFAVTWLWLRRSTVRGTR